MRSKFSVVNSLFNPEIGKPSKSLGRKVTGLTARAKTAGLLGVGGDTDRYAFSRCEQGDPVSKGTGRLCAGFVDGHPMLESSRTMS